MMKQKNDGMKKIRETLGSHGGELNNLGDGRRLHSTLIMCLILALVGMFVVLEVQLGNKLDSDWGRRNFVYNDEFQSLKQMVDAHDLFIGTLSTGTCVEKKAIGLNETDIDEIVGSSCEKFCDEQKNCNNLWPGNCDTFDLCTRACKNGLVSYANMLRKNETVCTKVAVVKTIR